MCHLFLDVGTEMQLQRKKSEVCMFPVNKYIQIPLEGLISFSTMSLVVKKQNCLWQGKSKLWRHLKLPLTQILHNPLVMPAFGNAHCHSCCYLVFAQNHHKELKTGGEGADRWKHKALFQSLLPFSCLRVDLVSSV